MPILDTVTFQCSGGAQAACCGTIFDGVSHVVLALPLIEPGQAIVQSESEKSEHAPEIKLETATDKKSRTFGRKR
jgi:hypothetical protein